MTKTIIELPFPPTVNNITTVVRGRKITSPKGREYRCEAMNRIAEQVICPLTTSRLAVTLELYPPDRRVRDLDNYSKGALDALTQAGYWADDEQIDQLTLIRRDVVKGGKCVVTIEEIADAA